ncbi:MAG: cytochrome d ubiquinol oxidase subunit II [Acidobacteria bacterium]|nr:cytochrome d ubiquinol oxidase subunit II [Acidobacteriota bacterium]
MPTFWFCAVAGMLALFAVLDGFDLGAGIIHLRVARTERERRSVLATIGPVWDGNEVWLIAAGGTLYFAFPRLYATSFSGFYLPLIIVLWLLMLRGIAIEFRNHVDHPVWIPFWDAVFSFASALLAFTFGAALGNVIRGVPLDASRYFFEPLWSDAGPGARTGILDLYTLLTGATAFVALAFHGAHWVVLKSEGAVRERSRGLALRAWWPLALLSALCGAATFRVQPLVAEGYARRPWMWLFPAMGVAALVLSRHFTVRRREMAAFFASATLLASWLASTAAGVYPNLLPSQIDRAYNLTIENAAAPSYGLGVGLAWWIPGMVLVTAYFAYAYRRHAGKTPAAEGAVERGGA